ncbi:MAG: hypothetical protein GC189_03300 [Alphaproteobacteria bacterium]|nr:hypothetical protein [Alphaproteobacteria bacterium]
MSASVYIATQTSGGVATIRLGADGGIFLTNGLCEELERALQAAADDASVRVIILTGASPGVFMRHYSVAEILQISANLRASGFKPGDNAPPHADAPIDRCIRLCETIGKPVIAAINGECMGGAMEIALGCDLRIAQSGDFRLGQPETMLGILPGAGGTQRLARVIGPAQAMAHALIGMPINPNEAFRLGMVHALAPDPLAAAQAHAAHFIAIPAPALAHVKRLVRESETLPLAEGLKLERALFMDLAVRDESIALMEAYEAGKHPLSRPV